MTNYKKHKISHKALLIITAIVITASGLSLNHILFNNRARADVFDEKIRQLRENNKYYESQAYDLRKKAESLEAEVAFINEQKAQIQVAINQINARIDALNKEIIALEKSIADNREALGDVIAKIYLSSQVSTIERLASSKAITDFIDEEAQNQTLRQNLSIKLKEIKQQREDVGAKKAEQVKVLEEQQKQMAAQVSLENEKQHILNQTKGDENLYRQMTEENNARIEKLRAEQIEANRIANAGFNIPKGIPGGGGYPGQWANAPLDAYVDPWGLYTRECVSYVAWKVYSTGRFVPHFGGRGNANQWPSTTARHGIPQGRQPKVGAAAVSMVGYYGHVMYVEAVHGDGTITVSDYNLNWDGLYRIYKRSASNLTYIYF